MTDDSRPPGTPEIKQASGPGVAATEKTATTILGGKYRIEREVGQGAFGRVYLGFDPMLRRNVAVKELLAGHKSADADTYARYLERFQREARAAGGLIHPNVVTVFELAVDAEANYYLVMEFVDGTDLRDLLDQVGTLPVERAVALAIEVASALDVVHENDIVHRDLKPANIMLTRRGTAKVTDFGVAQVGNESHRTQMAVGHPGTPMYMSPEQARGYGYIDGRSDLYSLGLILYEMLAGEPYARKRIPLGEKRPDLSAKLVAIVEKLTQEELRSRYQSAAALLDDLRQLSVASVAPSIRSEDASPVPPQEGVTRVGDPIAPGSQPPAPAFGVPSAYGGPASRSGVPVVNATPLAPVEEERATRVAAPHAAPIATLVAASPSNEATRVSAPIAPVIRDTSPIVGPPPAGPPASVSYAAASPAPARQSKRGLFIGLGGALIALIVVAGIVALVGRGGGKTSATYTAVPANTARAATAAVLPPAPVNTTITVTEKDFTIVMDRTSVPPGSITFNVTNQGPSPHNLVIKELNKRTKDIDAGKTDQLTVDMPSGAYTVICDIPGHEQLGMHMILTVGAASPVAGSPSATNTPAPARTATPGSGAAATSVPTNQQYVVSVAGGAAANLKEKPASDAATIGLLQPGSTVQATGPSVTVEGVTWLPASATQFSATQSSASRTGWVRRDNLSVAEGTAPASTPVAAANATTPAPTPVPMTTWTDPKGLVKLQYPRGWDEQTNRRTVAQAVLIVSGAGTSASSGVVRLEVQIYDPQEGTLEVEDQLWRNSLTKDSLSTYNAETTYYKEIAGERTATINYSSRPKTDSGPHASIGQIWLVNRGGKEFYIQISSTGTLLSADIDPIIASIVFTG